MDRKKNLNNVRREANIAISKVLDKVKIVSKTSILSLNINTLKSRINEQKKEIGDYVSNNYKNFEHVDVLSDIIQKIQKMEKEIDSKTEQIAKLKDNKNKEEHNPSP